jgi:hypothetical protein
MAASLAYRAAQGSVVLGVVHGGLTLASFISSFPVSARVTPVGEGTQPQVQTDPTQHTCAPPLSKDIFHQGVAYPDRGGVCDLPCLF